MSVIEPGDHPPAHPQHRAPGGHLPVSLSTFVGRVAELAELRGTLNAHRMLTVAGPGGAGKTRLAVRLAEEMVADFPGGVWWVSLASISDPNLLAPQVRRALELSSQPGATAMDTIVEFIDGHRMLLMLDNCEHLRDPCAVLTAALLSACPGLRVVATSREPIGVAGEVTWRIPALSLTDEAMELFLQRARLARPDFTATGDDVARVAEICRRLDGIPLAIELAAARVRVLSLSQIIESIHRRLVLLTGRSDSVMTHHQTLRASLEWSADLLSVSQLMLFRRLAAFPGSFDVDAVVAVAGEEAISRRQSVEDFIGLVDKSLVVVDHGRRPTRYAMLEIIREYALVRLAEAGEETAIRERHCAHYAGRFDVVRGVGPRPPMLHAETELDNLRAAFGWARRNGQSDLAARLASSLVPLWVRGRIVEGLAWFDAVLASGDSLSDAARVRALADKVTVEALNGDHRHRDQALQAVAIAREIGDPALLGRALAACGSVSCNTPATALPYFEEAISLAAAVDDDGWLSQIFSMQAYSAFLAGDLHAGRRAAESGRGLATAAGDGWTSRLCRWLLGMAQLLNAELDDAAAHGAAILAEAREAHAPQLIAQGSALLGLARSYRGDADGARAAVQAAVDISRNHSPLRLSVNLGRLARVLLAAGDVPGAVAAVEAATQACVLPELLQSTGRPAAEVALAAGLTAVARKEADRVLAGASGVHRVFALATCVRVEMAESRLDDAEHHARDALMVVAEAGGYLAVPDVIECLAILAVDQGRHRDAGRLFGSAAAVRGRTGRVRFKVYDDAYAASVGALRDAMGPQEFAESWAAGAALSTAVAVAEASRAAQPSDGRPRASDGWHALTPVERRVAELIRAGLRNKGIAERLSISPRTVESHLTRNYRRLQVSSRVQLAREAAGRPDLVCRAPTHLVAEVTSG